jgi:hypothetical protein
MPREKYYKVTIESGLDDGMTISERFFYINERDDELLWHLLNRIGVDRDKWEEQQQRRRNEEARRTREAYEREREAQNERNARARQADEEFRRRQQSRPNPNPFFFTADFGPTFGPGNPNFDNFFREFTAPGYSSTSTPTAKKLMADMAGVPWMEAKDMDPKKLLRKAQRKCHPDTGGSKEAWLELEKLQAEMGL